MYREKVSRKCCTLKSLGNHISRDIVTLSRDIFSGFTLTLLVQLPNEGKKPNGLEKNPHQFGISVVEKHQAVNLHSSQDNISSMVAMDEKLYIWMC